jgi:hypothetical protein
LLSVGAPVPEKADSMPSHPVENRRRLGDVIYPSIEVLKRDRSAYFYLVFAATTGVVAWCVSATDTLTGLHCLAYLGLAALLAVGFFCSRPWERKNAVTEDAPTGPSDEDGNEASPPQTRLARQPTVAKSLER